MPALLLPQTAAGGPPPSAPAAPVPPSISPTPAAPHRRPVPVLVAVFTAGTLLAGCGGGTGGTRGAGGPEPSASTRSGHAVLQTAGPVSSPGAPEPVPAGRGSEDPDDINGDGHRDLVVPLTMSGKRNRLGVIFGSASGLKPAVRCVYGLDDLGIDPEETDFVDTDPDDIDGRIVVNADLDSDGFPDFVTPVSRELSEKEAEEERKEVGSEGVVHLNTASLRVSWGGPRGPQHGVRSTVIRDTGKGTAGLEGPVRGDFDGDGNHDLAAVRQSGDEMVLLYGPFSRSGVPARTDVRPSEGWPAADAIDPTGRKRATALMLHDAGDDGGQSAATLYRAHAGSGPVRKGQRLREGNAVAFGDFDGDGSRDVAIGDDGSRNDEPGYETEDPDVEHSLAVHRGSGGAPLTFRIPGSENGDYGPGQYYSADPDGDGRDAVVVSTDDGALLIDAGADVEGGRRTEVSRVVPARMGGRKIGERARAARPFGAADFDGDGRDELVFGWGADGLFDLYGELPTHWWITDGTTARDKASFSALAYDSRKHSRKQGG